MNDLKTKGSSKLIRLFVLLLSEWKQSVRKLYSRNHFKGKDLKI